MEYSNETKKDMVSRQYTKENTIVKKNTEVVVDFSLGPEKVKIPSVIGMGREEARKMLKEAGFMNIKEEESQDIGLYDSVLDVSVSGFVPDVSGEQAEPVELTREIILTICKNKTAQEGDSTVKVEIPDVVGMKRKDAEAALKEAGLQINPTYGNSELEEGTVLGQEPTAGEVVNKESIVTVQFSLGAEKLYMKNVELESQEDAEKMIMDLGLAIGKITKEYSNSVDKGKVISQSIANDTEVKQGDTVDLVISLGPETREPKKSETKPAPTQKSKNSQTQQPSALPRSKRSNLRNRHRNHLLQQKRRHLHLPQAEMNPNLKTKRKNRTLRR